MWIHTGMNSLGLGIPIQSLPNGLCGALSGSALQPAAVPQPKACACNTPPLTLQQHPSAFRAQLRIWIGISSLRLSPCELSLP